MKYKSKVAIPSIFRTPDIVLGKMKNSVTKHQNIRVYHYIVQVIKRGDFFF